jgi:hypothetical protein
VKELGAKDKDNEDAQSDSEYFCSEIKKAGYWTRNDILDALDYGSFCPRKRMYWAAVRLPEGTSSEQVHVFFNSIINGMKMKSSWPAERFITMDDDLRTSQVAANLSYCRKAFFGARLLDGVCGGLTCPRISRPQTLHSLASARPDGGLLASVSVGTGLSWQALHSKCKNKPKKCLSRNRPLQASSSQQMQKQAQNVSQ